MSDGPALQTVSPVGGKGHPKGTSHEYKPPALCLPRSPARSRAQATANALSA